MTIDEAIKNCEKTAKECIENCAGTELYQCGKDFEQLASWLQELKEAKRLLKFAVEDFKTLVLKSTTVCNMKIECNKCPLNCTNDNLGWKKEAEALKLIGEEGEQNAD